MGTQREIATPLDTMFSIYVAIVLPAKGFLLKVAIQEF